MSQDLTLTQKEMMKLARNAGNASELLKAMSNESRLMILCSLMENELSVGELNERVPLSQSALSQHLSALRKAGLVSTRREAQCIFYRVHNPAVLQIISVLKNIFCQS